jgi:hypothetical protein
MPNGTETSMAIPSSSATVAAGPAAVVDSLSSDGHGASSAPSTSAGRTTAASAL